MSDLVVRGERVALPGGAGPAALQLRDGKIHAVTAHGHAPAGVPVLNAGDLVVLPGLVDTHVHMNDPGRAEWEGAESATRAAAAGGVTTLIDMPLNSVPATTSLAGLAAKREALRDRCMVDVGFWGGVVPGNASALAPLVDAGVLGFKCFLSPSGVDEFGHVSASDLRKAMPILSRLGVPLLVHAELPEALLEPDDDHPRRYATWLESRPPEAERRAIELLIALSEAFRSRVHVVHLATAAALPVLRDARRRGVAISVETCPHYLTFAAEDIADGATPFKCAPPIRGREEREALWNALRSGDIDLVASDHSPAPPADKCLDDGDFLRAWGGIASLQLGLAAVWTGARARGIGIERVAEWMSAAPARLAGLPAKGQLVAGADADILLFDPDADFTVDPAALYHRHPLTPYAGMRLKGVVRTTLLRGEPIWREGAFAAPPRGQLI